MILYHVTRKEAAASIISGGFRDATGSFFTDAQHKGVWLSDRPLDSNEGAWGDTTLAVDLACTEGTLADFEWVEEGESKNYREWLVPAALINSCAHVSICEEPSDPGVQFP